MSATSASALLNELPARARHGGFIYVIEFSNSDTTVKVGSTSDPRSRFASHRASGEPFGIDISQWWLSPQHLDYEKSEDTLVRLVEGLGGRKVRKEYFTGVSFGQVAALADSMGIVESTPTDVQLATQREQVSSQQRKAEHDADDRANVQVGLRFTAERFGMTPEQVADIVRTQPGSLAARWFADMVDAARSSRLAWHRGNRQDAV